jgi:hypothetical protein
MISSSDFSIVRFTIWIVRYVTILQTGDAYREIVYRKIRVLVESSRYSSAIRISYRIERYSDSVMTNGKSSHFVSYRFDSHRCHLLIAFSYPSYRTRQIDGEIEIDYEFWFISLLHSLRTTARDKETKR